MKAAHLIVWVSLLCTYLVVSLNYLAPAISPLALEPANSLYSTDSYLQNLTGTAHASNLILRALAPLPRDKTIVLVLPDRGPRSGYIAMNLSYLSWPHAVRCLSAAQGDVADQLSAISPASIAAIIFWDTPAFLSNASATQIGPRQLIVPLRLTSIPRT